MIGSNIQALDAIGPFQVGSPTFNRNRPWIKHLFMSGSHSDSFQKIRLKMNMQQVLLALFAFLGLAACAQIQSQDDLTKFKKELSDAETGNQVGYAVNKPEKLADFLLKLAEETPEYAIPFMNDDYRRFRFCNGILAHYRARAVEKEVLEREINEKSLSLNNLENEIARLNDEISMESGLYSKLFSGKQKERGKKQAERQEAQSVLDTKRERLAQVTGMIPKFDKFVTKFNVVNEHASLYARKPVSDKLAEDKVSPADVTFIEKLKRNIKLLQ